MITRTLINTLFISNSQEAKEYFYRNISVFHILIALVFLFAFFFILLSSRKLNAQRLKINFILLFCLSFALSSFSGPLGAFTTEYLLYQKEKSTLKRVSESRKHSFSLNSLEIKEEPIVAEKIVIIIGESLNRSYMSLYGYEESTNPNLMELYTDSSKGRLFVFKDVISPNVTTVPSLRMVLTSINVDNGLSFEESVTIPELFKKAGYETFWLSNHAPLGPYDTPNSVIASSNENIYYTSYNDKLENENSTGNYFDEELITKFEEYNLRSNKNERQIYFIHLQGSHTNYEDRYPAKFNFFDSKKSGDKNSYLNSVLYNDWVVSSIIKKAQEYSFEMVCYFSDHGEDLINNHNQEKYKPSMSTIPFMVYLSNSYIKEKPKLFNNLIKLNNYPAMTDNFFHDIQEISGIKSSFYDSTESFISGNRIIRKRLIMDKTRSFD